MLASTLPFAMIFQFALCAIHRRSGCKHRAEFGSICSPVNPFGVDVTENSVCIAKGSKERKLVPWRRTIGKGENSVLAPA